MTNIFVDNCAMLSPEMILDNVRYGEKLETEGAYYKAYWVYLYAETSVDREDEARCLIGSKSDFAEAEGEAGYHRQKVWRYLTEEEKEKAIKGINPFVSEDTASTYLPYNLEASYLCYVETDKRRESEPKHASKERMMGCLAGLLFLVIKIKHLLKGEDDC